MTRLLFLVLTALVGGCATHAMWVDDQTVIIEDYPTARVRIYRGGPHCRVEVITASESIVTLPTRCRTVPHVARP
jgi:hypothetical protein